MNWRSFLFAALVCGPAVMAQMTPGGVGGMGGNGGVGVLEEDRERYGGKTLWRPWLRVIGYYNDYLSAVDESGDIVTTRENYGVEGVWGLSAWKSSRRTTILGRYTGSQSVVFTQNGLAGLSNVGFVGASHQVNRDFSISGQQLIGDTLGGYGIGAGFVGLGGGFGNIMQSQQFSGGGALGFGDPSLNGLVDDEIFSNRVKFSASSGSVGYRLGMRSYISASGGAYFARRQATLADTNTYYTGASYNYMLDRNSEIGAGYSFATMSYPGRFGGNRIQSLSLQYGKRFRNRSGVSLNGGIGYFDSSYVGLVAVDPDLAQSLGVSTLTQVQRAQRRYFAGSAVAFYNTDTVNVTFSALRNVVPGNGILYAGVRDILAVSLSRNFLQESRMIIGLTANVGRTSGLLQSDVQLRYQLYGFFTYRFVKGLSAITNGGVRWQRLDRQGPYLPSRFISIGLNWSPEGSPLPF